MCTQLICKEMSIFAHLNKGAEVNIVDVKNEVNISEVNKGAEVNTNKHKGNRRVGRT